MIKSEEGAYGSFFLNIKINSNQMKKLFLLMLLVLAIVSCSIEGIQEPIRGLDGKDGIDGISSTITVITEEEGYWLIFFEDSVETSRIFVMNGIDGTDGIDGTNGTNGTNGTDGTNGQDGEDGIDGTDGYNSLIRHSQLVNTLYCDYGGILVEYGLDLNRNGLLDNDEVTGSYEVCKCVCETSECDVPYYKIELICCDDYYGEGLAKTVCEVTGIKVIKGIVGKPELETEEIICFE